MRYFLYVLELEKRKCYYFGFYRLLFVVVEFSLCECEFRFRLLDGEFSLRYGNNRIRSM